MKIVIGILLMIAGAIGGLYIGGWLMFIQSILGVCQAFDSHTLTGTLIGWVVIKCLFASFVGGLIFWIGVILGNAIID